jgi:hypothetical protein
LIAILAFVSTVDPASADEVTDSLEVMEHDCETLPENLLCEYFPRIFPEIREAVEDEDRWVEDVVPRMLVALGGLAGAFDVADAYGRWPSDTLELGSNYTRPIVTDPIFPIYGETPGVAESEYLETWAQVVLARSLAESGEREKAREIFGRLHGSLLPIRTSHRRWVERFFFAQWSAAGFEDDAVALLALMTAGEAGWARTGIAEGLAFRGDIDACLPTLRCCPVTCPLWAR